MRFLISILISVLLLGSPVALFAQDAGQGKFEPLYGTVLVKKVNIRAGQGVNFEVLGQLNKADAVAVIGEEYGWYKIKLPATAICFVHKDYIERGVVKAGRLRVRAASRLNSNTLGMLKKGERIEKLAEEGDWLKIMPPDNCAGWVKKDYLQLTKRKFIPPKFSPISRRERKLEEIVFLPERKKREMKKVASVSKAKKGKTKGFFSFFKKKLKETTLLPKAEGRIIEVCGKVDDLGKIFNRQGTHKLIKGKKTLYYLKSETLDLNRFIYDRVCIVGKLFELGNSPYPLITVEQIKVEQ